MMDLIVLLISLDIIASKFLECFTSTVGVQNIQLQRYSLSRDLLEKLGIKYNVWFNLLLTISAVNVAVLMLSALPYQLLFVFTGFFLTAVNLGAAHSNYYGKKNFITELLLR